MRFILLTYIRRRTSAGEEEFLEEAVRRLEKEKERDDIPFLYKT